MIDDQTFNNLTWQKVDERELDTFIKNATILETEGLAESLAGSYKQTDQGLHA